MKIDTSSTNINNICDSKTSQKKDLKSDSTYGLKNIEFNQKKYTELMHKAGYTDYYVSDDTPIPYYTAQFGLVKNDFEFSAKFHSSRREAINSKINKLLDINGVDFAKNEKIIFEIDASGNITVTGSSDQANKAIADVLNKNNLGDELANNILNVNLFNKKKFDQSVYTKWEVARFIKRETGQNLSDLHLENGNILGGNELFVKLMNADSSFDSDMLQFFHGSGGIKDRLISVLSFGVDKIKDRCSRIEYQDGSLNDIDVVFGFGNKQLESWCNGNILGKKNTIDVKV